MIMKRLSSLFCGEAINEAIISQAEDPLFVHCMFCEHSLADAQRETFGLRSDLNEAVKEIENLVTGGGHRDRYFLEDSTLRLHPLSQKIDTLVVSMESTEMIAD